MMENPYTSFAPVGIKVTSGHAEARELLMTAMKPAPAKTIISELARLRQLTIARNSSQEDLRLVAAIYAEELSMFPADATIATLRAWPRKNKFWPTLAELLPEIRNACPWRMMLAEALP